jgi:hypothetical protein
MDLLNIRTFVLRSLQSAICIVTESLISEHSLTAATTVLPLPNNSRTVVHISRLRPHTLRLSHSHLRDTFHWRQSTGQGEAKGAKFERETDW